MQYSPAPVAPTELLPRSFLGRNRKLLIAATVLLIAFGYFSFNAFSSATAYYLTVDEVIAEGHQLADRPFRVKGRLVEGSFRREEASTLAHFRIHDNGVALNATYDGVLPDLFFNEHSEIVLHGQLEPEGLFIADRVLVKCPSKYEAHEEVPDRYQTSLPSQ